LVILAGYFEITTGLPPTEVTIKASQQIVGDTTVVDFQQQQNNSETLQIVVSSDMIALPIKQQPKQQATALVDSIKSLNIQNGFYQKEKVVNKEISADESWWKRNISSNLNHFIKEKFGEKQVRQVELSTVGNCGIASFKLSKKPDDKVVVNVSFKSGSKDIVLIEGSRFEFTTANWNKPAYTVFQLDSKLSAQTQTLFQARSGNIPLAWTITFVVLAALFVLFFVYHQFILPYPLSDKPVKSEKSPFVEFFRTFMLFFTKKNIGITILFLLTYRLGEAQLVKMAAPFLLDSRSIGGLGLTTSSIGLIYGTIGIIALTIGGILGGIAVSSRGLKFWIWWMALCINFPHLTYIYLSYAQPTSYLYITMAVAVEQFGYGFGFTAYMLYMIKEAEGEHKTAHFAMMTAFMALSMMLPGMWSGWIQDLIGYKHFFVWVLICALPSLLIVKFVKVDAGFGVKQKDKKEA